MKKCFYILIFVMTLTTCILSFGCTATNLCGHVYKFDDYYNPTTNAEGEFLVICVKCEKKDFMSFENIKKLPKNKIEGKSYVTLIVIEEQLNEAKRRPITNAVSSLKNRIEWYVEYDDEKDDQNGFTQYMKEFMPELIVDSNIDTDVRSCSDDKIHVLLDSAIKLKSSTWSFIVYNKEYKQKITYVWNSSSADFTYFKSSSVIKIDEDF